VNALFRPIGIALGLASGLVASRIFDFVWSKIDDQEAPEPKHREVPWVKMIAALALQGAIFRIVRGLVDNGSRRGFAALTGTWPGEERPDPE
jgi:hypothetical protein